MVLHDEIGLSPDELQVLTNDLCYTFARSTTAVSIVSPAYYARLACERGRCYLRSLFQGITKQPDDLYDQDPMLEAKSLWKDGVAQPLKETMFYL